MRDIIIREGGGGRHLVQIYLKKGKDQAVPAPRSHLLLTSRFTPGQLTPIYLRELSDIYSRLGVIYLRVRQESAIVHFRHPERIVRNCSPARPSRGQPARYIAIYTLRFSFEKEELRADLARGRA